MTPRRTMRIAVALWITLAVVVWNVVFDRVIVEAGRAYIRAAREAVAAGAYLKVGDWMADARMHGVWLASVVALAILVFGLVAIRMAWRREQRRCVP